MIFRLLGTALLLAPLSALSESASPEPLTFRYEVTFADSTEARMLVVKAGETKGVELAGEPSRYISEVMRIPRSAYRRYKKAGTLRGYDEDICLYGKCWLIRYGYAQSGQRVNISAPARGPDDTLVMFEKTEVFPDASSAEVPGFKPMSLPERRISSWRMAVALKVGEAYVPGAGAVTRPLTVRLVSVD